MNCFSLSAATEWASNGPRSAPEFRPPLWSMVQASSMKVKLGSGENYDTLLWVNIIGNNSIAEESTINCNIIQIFILNHLKKPQLTEPGIVVKTRYF